VGAQTELIFDGGSVFISKEGAILEELNYFEEDYRILDTETSVSNLQPESGTIEKIYRALVLGIRDYFTKMGFRTATLGLSGGIDSALVLVLAVEALGKENVRVLLMPSRYSSDHSVNDALQLARNLEVQYEIIPIQEMVASFEQSLSGIFTNLKNDVTEENIQARTRGILLMAIFEQVWQHPAEHHQQK